MSHRKKIELPIHENTINLILNRAAEFEHVFLLSSGNCVSTPPGYKNYKYLGAIGAKHILSLKTGNAFEQLENFWHKYNDWLFGFLGYDLKNELENLVSENKDNLEFPDLFFMVPQIVFYALEDRTVVEFCPSDYSEHAVRELFTATAPIKPNKEGPEKIVIQSLITKKKYIESIKSLQRHIKNGDIYEANYCMEFFAHTTINPFYYYAQLLKVAATPFSVFAKINDKYILSASPERFLKKEGNNLMSQPIKGTAKRGKTPTEDRRNIQQLESDPKERAENIMIVDLVRNDLARIAQRASVKVDELCRVYTFPQVHQLISTISAKLDQKYTWNDALKKTYPMGSMTGAPKINAMKLIDSHESFKRGLYSGAIGYIKPNQDFDFNVVIRTILYNHTKKYLSYSVGSAITDLSDPEKEYLECELKILALQKILSDDSEN